MSLTFHHSYLAESRQPTLFQRVVARLVAAKAARAEDETVRVLRSIGRDDLVPGALEALRQPFLFTPTQGQSS